jgi:hypothetical protein
VSGSVTGSCHPINTFRQEDLFGKEFEIMLGNITRLHLKHKNVFSYSIETDAHQNNHHVDVPGLL